MNLTGKRILVAGLGKSGISAAALLKKKGSKVCLFEGEKSFDKKTFLENYPKFSDCVFLDADFSKADLAEIVLAVVSPGIPSDSAIMCRLRQENIPLWGEMELACRMENGRIAAITGTNGKTTTTTLVGEILKKCYSHVFVAGNIGIPYTSIAEQTTQQSITVAEVSSFQLETMDVFHPRVSAILNITPDHLDRHHTMQNYIQIKESITKRQTQTDTCVLNYEDETLRAFAATLKSQVLFFSSKRRLEEGIYLEEDAIWIAAKKKEKKCLIHTRDLKLPGIHNYENVMAAAGIALSLGAPIECAQEVLKSFVGVKHRLEFVQNLHHVFYYNDSKATNPDAAISGIQAMNRKTILIAGGYDKNLEFDDWINSFAGKVKCLVLLGETKEKIAACARKHGFTQIVYCDTLKEAVEFCYQEAKPGEAVLLSPACASWDSFSDYQERGNLFRQYVKELWQREQKQSLSAEQSSV